MSLGYLVCPTIQIQDINGKPIVGAKIYVYDANTSELTNTYKDFEGHLNTNPVLTDDLGNCTIIADDNKVYNIVVNDNNDNLLFSKDNLTCGSSVTYMSVDAGYGIQITENNGTYTIAVDTDLIATKDDLAAKQDKLYAGDNIEIDEENQINVVNRREFQVQYPLRLDRSNDRLKLYIDSDFAINDISAGPDIKITKYGNDTFVGVDTNSVANGEYNFYAGNSNTVSGNNNAVFGIQNITNGYANAVFGGSNSASCNNSLLYGYNNDIVGNSSTNDLVGGFDNIVSDAANTCVIGMDNTVSGDKNAVFGQSNNVSGYLDYVYGTNHTVQGARHTVFGANNAVSGFDNFVAGSQNLASDNTLYNTIFGNDNTVYDNHSYNLVGGTHNKVSTEASFVHGISNTVTQSNDNVIGAYNNVNAAYSFVGGDYNTISGEYNRFVGQSNTATGTYLYGVGYNNKFYPNSNNNFTMSYVLGANNEIDGQSYAIAVGFDNTVWHPQHSNSQAYGNSNDIFGSNSYAFGKSNTIRGTAQYIIGDTNKIDNVYANYNKDYVFGFSNTVSASNATMAIGYELSANSKSNEIQIGFGNTYLKITPTGISKVINGTETPL